jgi:hypothetical protein
MLTGRRVYGTYALFELVELVRSAKVPSPRRVRPEIEPSLEAVLLRSLARRPSERHQTADELRLDLCRHLGNRPRLAVRAELAAFLKDLHALSKARARQVCSGGAVANGDETIEDSGLWWDDAIDGEAITCVMRPAQVPRHGVREGSSLPLEGEATGA